MTDVTNQGDDQQDDFVTDDADGVSDDQVNDQAETDESEDDAEGDETEEGEEGSQDDEFEDYEEDGKTYKVPKDLKGHLLRNSDYTRKTQELAEQRRAFEAEREQVKATDEAIEEARFAQKQVSQRLADIQALSEQDWQQIRVMDAQNGTNNYDKLQREFMNLPRQADEAKRILDQKVKEATEAQQQAAAQRIQEGHEILVRDIPGWGPDLGAKLTGFVASEFGITPDRHGKAFEDPALVKLAYAAFKAKEAQRKNQTKERAEKSTQNQPAKVVKAGSSPKPGLHSGLSAKQWADRRNQELASKGRR